jgi:hypothetical protein
MQLGKFLITAGLFMVAIGGLLVVAGKTGWTGKLPGDILIQRRNLTFYFPLATSIVLSLLLTFLFWFLGRR